MASIIISIVALVVAAATLAYSVKVALVYHRFNEQIKDWSEDLDSKMRYAIDVAARGILKELDDKITNNDKINEEEDE